MTKHTIANFLFFGTSLLQSACGGDSGSEPSVGNSSEPSGGQNSASGGQEAVEGSGGTATGGTASGGTTSDDPGEAGHCGELTVNNAFALYPGYMVNCDDDSAGLDLSDSLSPWVKSIELETPIGPGDTWAFSTYVTGGGPFDLYGAKEECGGALELLDSTTEYFGEEDAVICLEAAPQDDTYTHLVWVWHAGSEHRETAICPAGSCPAL